MSRKSLLIVLIILSSLLIVPSTPVNAAQGYTTTTLTPTADGYIYNSTGTFTKYESGNDIDIRYDSGTPYIQRGYIRWNTSSIPDTAWIYKLEFLCDGHDGSGTDPGYKFVNMTTDPVGAANQTIYDSIGSGEALVENQTKDYTDLTVTLAEEHDANCTSFQSALAGGKDWFALGILSLDESGADNRWRIYSSEGGQTPVPSLKVYYYTGTPFTYSFSGAYYENGTAYGSEVTVTVSDSYSEEVDVNGSTETEYYDLQPALFTWSIGSGDTRTVFSPDAIGSENITVLMPEDTYAAYSFTVKDYTGKSGVGETFLEAYRIVNGTETLVERGKLYKGNTVPLNLVVGKTYTLKILWSDGSRYAWGYFVPQSDTSINLIIDEMEFTDKAQTMWQWVTVESTRLNGTHIQVEYDDERTNSVWVNISVRERGNSTLAYSQNNSDTDTVDTVWDGADSSTAYVVTVEVEHSDFGESTAVFVHDPSYSFPDIPSLDGLFSFGSLDVDTFVAFLLSLTIGAFTFSYVWKAIAGVATMSIATFLAWFDYGSWNFYILAFGWFIAVLIILAGVRNR